MNRHSEIVTAGAVSLETYVDGAGPDVMVLPSYGRDGGDDFEPFTAALVSAGYRVLRPQPRGIGKSIGPMSGVVFDDLAEDIAHVIDHLAGGPTAVLGHAFGNFVARAVATNHPVPPEIDSALMRAADPTLPDDERLAALRLAYFAPGHDASIWLTGWYPQTLKMQQASVRGLVGLAIDR